MSENPTVAPVPARVPGWPTREDQLGPGGVLDTERDATEPTPHQPMFLRTFNDGIIAIATSPQNTGRK